MVNIVPARLSAKLVRLEKRARVTGTRLFKRYRRRLTIIVASTLALVLLVLGAFFTHRYIHQTPTVLIADLDAMTFDERYENKALREYPMIKRPIKSKLDSVFESGCRDPLEEAKKPRANAAFVVLARNNEIDGVLDSMHSLERHFNQWFNYPWIFLNDEKFTKEFRTAVKAAASGQVKFSVIPTDKWNMPVEKDDPVLFNEAVEEQGDRGIMYGNMAAYHRMCRFYSGHFYDNNLVQHLDWYWRVEPDVEFYCDLTYDPFIEMEKHGKKYGYTIMIKELENTVPTLFRETLAFARHKGIEPSHAFDLFTNNYTLYQGEHEKSYQGVRNDIEFWRRLQEMTPVNYARQWGLDDNEAVEPDKYSLESLAQFSSESAKPVMNSVDNVEYNLCHYWSNFEISRVDVFRSELYQEYFEWLEKAGGFYDERWGDAPVHSLAMALILSADENEGVNTSAMHYFRDIGYRHTTLTHCPANSPNQNPPYQESPAYKHGFSKKIENYWANYDFPISNDAIGVGCRCRCPFNHQDIENRGSACTSVWSKVTSDDREPRRVYNLNIVEKEAVKLYKEYLENHPDSGASWKLSKAQIEELKQYTVPT